MRSEGFSCRFRAEVTFGLYGACAAFNKGLLFSHMISSQNNASKLLLAIMESRHDSENAERILYNMRPKELVCVCVSVCVCVCVCMCV